MLSGFLIDGFRTSPPRQEKRRHTLHNIETFRKSSQTNFDLGLIVVSPVLREIERTSVPMVRRASLLDQWVFIATEHDQTFRKHCPCGQGNDNRRILLRNRRTRSYLVVGTECIEVFEGAHATFSLLRLAKQVLSTSLQARFIGAVPPPDGDEKNRKLKFSVSKKSSKLACKCEDLRKQRVCESTPFCKSKDTKGKWELHISGNESDFAIERRYNLDLRMMFIEKDGGCEIRFEIVGFEPQS